MNFATLEKITDGKNILVDSTFVRWGEEDFVYLKLKPIEKGAYKLTDWGCRHGKEIFLSIE